jgi:hypothetical protein
MERVTPADVRKAAQEYQEKVGAGLRAVRISAGLSLNDVEVISQGTWKVVVVGSYERGQRAITVGRLAQLVDFYAVQITDVLPGGGTVDVQRAISEGTARFLERLAVAARAAVSASLPADAIIPALPAPRDAEPSDVFQDVR